MCPMTLWYIFQYIVIVEIVRCKQCPETVINHKRKKLYPLKSLYVEDYGIDSVHKFMHLLH